MALRSSVKQFVSSIEGVARNFSGLKTGDTIIPLVHSFWSPEDIAKGLNVKAEWDVPDQLVPFYGDWHDLLCISSVTGEVLLLDDDRSVVSAWDSGDDFVACLTYHPTMDEEVGGSESSGIIGGRLDF
jgi:hypothetical protein